MAKVSEVSIAGKDGGQESNKGPPRVITCPVSSLNVILKNHSNWKLMESLQVDSDTVEASKDSKKVQTSAVNVSHSKVIRLVKPDISSASKTPEKSFALNRRINSKSISNEVKQPNEELKTLLAHTENPVVSQQKISFPTQESMTSFEVDRCNFSDDGLIKASNCTSPFLSGTKSKLKPIVYTPKMNPSLKTACKNNKSPSSLAVLEELMESVEQSTPVISPPKVAISKASKTGPASKQISEQLSALNMTPERQKLTSVMNKRSPSEQKIRKVRRQISGSSLISQTSFQSAISFLTSVPSESRLPPLLKPADDEISRTDKSSTTDDNEQTLSLDSIFEEYRVAQEAHGSDKSASSNFKNKGLSWEDATTLVAQKRQELLPSLDSCMGIGVKQLHYFDLPAKVKKTRKSRHWVEADQKESEADEPSESGYEEQGMGYWLEAPGQEPILLTLCLTREGHPVLCRPGDIAESSTDSSGVINTPQYYLQPSLPETSAAPTVETFQEEPQNTSELSEIQPEQSNSSYQTDEINSVQLRETEVYDTPTHPNVASTVPLANDEQMRSTTSESAVLERASESANQVPPSTLTLEASSIGKQAVPAPKKRKLSAVLSDKSPKSPAFAPPPKKSIKARQWMKSANSDEKQLSLDFGQTMNKIEMCKECRFGYNPQHAVDVELHRKHHARVLETSKPNSRLVQYTPKGKEVVVSSFEDGGQIFSVDDESPSGLLNQVEKLRQAVELDLGFAPNAYGDTGCQKTLVYLAPPNHLVGYLQATQIDQGYRVILPEAEAGDERTRTRTHLLDWDSVSVSTVPEPASLGVNQIWVAAKHQRNGIATRLLDTLRSTFQSGEIISKDAVAFSDPSLSGQQFAANYLGRPDFLVFKVASTVGPVRDFLKEQEERDAALLYQ